MDTYSLINSKAIQEHCRKIQHKFNTEELAVLIYRNKRMSIEEKIQAYQELIVDYPDMEVIERINCKHYDSVKDMIRGEIDRVKELIKILNRDEQDVVYSYNYWCDGGYNINEGKRNEYRDIYKTFKEVENLIHKEIKDDEEQEIISFVVTKRTFSRTDKFTIRAEYLLDENRKLKMVNIYDFEGEWLDISNICLNIPTPFKKGDLLVSTSKTPFGEGFVLNYDKFPFVLHWLCTWRENFQEILDRGSHDSSDMQGPGYLMSEYGEVYADNIFDYDSWEYFEGDLKGNNRILKAISSLMKDEIDIDLFINAYKYMYGNKVCSESLLSMYTDEGLSLVGLSDEEIKKIKGK